MEGIHGPRGGIHYGLVVMKSLSRLKLVLPFVAAAAAVAVMPGSAAAFHTDITGVASCLAANGTYSVTWTVVVPNETWAIGSTATLMSSIALSPGGPLSPGQSATGTGTGYTGATATISVTSSWVPSGNVETDGGSVARPTTPCPTPTTTTTAAPAAPTTTAPAADVCANIDGIQTSVPAGYVAAGTTCTPASATPAPTTTSPGSTPVVAPADVCSNLAGVQTSVPTGYVLRNGRCTSSAAAAAGVNSTAGAGGLLPATGSSWWPSLLAAVFVMAGGMALWAVGRSSLPVGQADPQPTSQSTP